MVACASLFQCSLLQYYAEIIEIGDGWYTPRLRLQYKEEEGLG
jgi:hypothetical protein